MKQVRFPGFLGVILGVSFGIGSGACAPGWKQTPHDRMFQREAVKPIPRVPERRPTSDWWDHGLQLIVRPIGRALSPGRWISGAMGGRAARDVNDLGQVPDSDWFENRISRRTLTVDEAFRGPTQTTGPAVGPLFVISGKVDGATAGFVVRDRDGITWYLKLDPPSSPELTTSAEVIASRLLWMAGYHVPELHAIDIEARRFLLDPKAKTKDHYGRKIPLTPLALDRLLRPLNTDKAGRVRVLVSRQPDGVVLGPFDYRGLDPDDANDKIPHEHRRSLRALWVFSAWLNNTDTRNQNSLDVFRPVDPTTPDGPGMIRHYLLDFGNSLGATGTGEKIAESGFEYVFDWRVIMSNLFAVGLRTTRYERLRRSPYRSVGIFESKAFQPHDWRPTFPNPAFEECTRSDTFWAASILARIQPDHIRAAVSAGRYHEDGATTHVVQTLLERRRKMLIYGFTGFLEIDQPRARGHILIVDDLRAIAGLPNTGPLSYKVHWNRTRGVDRELAHGSVGTTSPDRPTIHDTGEPSIATARVLGEVQIDLSSTLAALQREAGFADDPFITVELTRTRLSARVHLRVVGDTLLPVSLDR